MARAPSAKQVAELPQDKHLLAKLVALETYLRSPDSARNGAAYVAGTRLAVSLRAELQALHDRSTVAAPAAAPVGRDLTDDELVLALGDALRKLPLPVMDRVLEEVGAERYEVDPAPPLRLVEGA